MNILRSWVFVFGFSLNALAGDLTMDTGVFFSPEPAPIKSTGCVNKDTVYPFNSCTHMPTLHDLAIKKAKAEGKSVLLVFGRPNCGWTKALIRLFTQPKSGINDELIATLKERFVVVLIRTKPDKNDLDEGAGMTLESKYKVFKTLGGVPALVKLSIESSDDISVTYIQSGDFEIQDDTKDKLEKQALEAGFNHNPEKTLEALLRQKQE
jgi:thioredoxin-related protein